MDRIDRAILAVLRTDGRISNLDLAERVGLSPTPCGRRLKRLEDAGVIEGYAARINPKALGLTISVMIGVRLVKQTPDASAQFLSAIRELPEVTEWMFVTGSMDYLIRVWVKDVKALRRFIAESLQAIPSVAETSTMVTLDSQSAV